MLRRRCQRSGVVATTVAAMTMLLCSTAMAQYTGFTPTGEVGLSATPTSSRATIPTGGTPTIVVVANPGSYPAYVLLGNSSVVATVATGMPIMPHDKEVLTIGSNTHIAGITASNGTGLRVTAGKTP